MVGLLCAKQLARITYVPVSYIIPVVVVLCLTGSYVARREIWDVLLTLIAGGVGYGMKKFDFPIACFVLGYVLGVMAEDNFFLALSLADGNYATFVNSPISLGLLFLLLYMIIHPVVKAIFKKEGRKSRGGS
jgi:putative tricarboxylic transport membrane protein